MALPSHQPLDRSSNEPSWTAAPQVSGPPPQAAAVVSYGPRGSPRVKLRLKNGSNASRVGSSSPVQQGAPPGQQLGGCTPMVKLPRPREIEEQQGVQPGVGPVNGTAGLQAAHLQACSQQCIQPVSAAWKVSATVCFFCALAPHASAHQRPHQLVPHCSSCWLTSTKPPAGWCPWLASTHQASVPAPTAAPLASQQRGSTNEFLRPGSFQAAAGPESAHGCFSGMAAAAAVRGISDQQETGLRLEPSGGNLPAASGGDGGAGGSAARGRMAAGKVSICWVVDLRPACLLWDETVPAMLLTASAGVPGFAAGAAASCCGSFDGEQGCCSLASLQPEEHAACLSSLAGKCHCACLLGQRRTCEHALQGARLDPYCASCWVGFH